MSEDVSCLDGAGAGAAAAPGVHSAAAAEGFHSLALTFIALYLFANASSINR